MDSIFLYLQRTPELVEENQDEFGEFAQARSITGGVMSSASSTSTVVPKIPPPLSATSLVSCPSDNSNQKILKEEESPLAFITKEQKITGMYCLDL